MKTKSTRAFTGSNVVVLICFMILQSFSMCRAQTRPDYQTVQNFFNAIALNDTNTASQLLESNTNLVFSSYDGGKLPLLEAAAAGNVPLVKRLLELGTGINAEGDTLGSGGARMTALDEAAQHGHLEVCKLLLGAGANPNHRAFQDTTLHFAFNNFVFSTNRNAVATILLEYGANPFAEAGYYKTTPLELAITRSDGRLVPLILDTDRKIKSAPNSRPHRPTRNKAASAKDQAAQFLAARGLAMLSAAAQRGELEAVQALLNAGVSAKTNASGELPLLQSFAVSEVATVRDWPSAMDQWQQTSNQLKNLGTNVNPQFLASIRSREAEQAAKVESSSPERWRQIRNLLIKNGVEYDAFAATALGDTNQVQQLFPADKNVIQSRDRDGDTPLHWAVQTDQLPMTGFWLQAGASPAATNFAGQTPLHIAAGKNLVEHMKLLLAAHAPTDARDTNGWTPLDVATHAQNTEAIRLLLSYKTVAPRPERAIAISIHDAAASGNLAALAALTETTNNLEARNELGLTPLQVAVLNGHLAAAALLVDRGADVNVRDPDGNTMLLQILLQERNLFVRDRPPASWLDRMADDPRKSTYVKYLTVGQYEQGPNPDEQGPNPVLQTASFLLACGVDARATNHAGQTAVQLVTGGGTSRYIFFFNDDQTALLKLFGIGGSNINESDSNGDTALHRLANSVDANNVDRLAGIIASGADVNATNFQGQTALHIAVKKIDSWPSYPGGPDNPMLLLIKAKASVNAQDNEGMTPLHMLASADTSFRKEATEALLAAGANPNLRDNQGRTPLHVLALADNSFRKGATKALLDAAAKPNLRDNQGRTPAHLFLTGKWPWEEAGECIELLVKAGADLSAKDEQGRTPLHYLAALGSQSPLFFFRGIGDLFIAAKVDVNARDNDGNTPLHIAAKNGTRDVYDWLLKHGANLDATNNAGQTPRVMAMHSTEPLSRFRFDANTDIYEAVREGKLETVVAMLKTEPDLLNKTNQSGQSSLLVAAESHHTNIVDFLDKQGALWDPVSAVLAGRIEVLRNLAAQQPQIITNRSNSLLHLAARIGNAGAAGFLLSAGVDMNAVDSTGRSPLGDARLYHHAGVADLVAAHGGTENIFDAAFTDDDGTVAERLIDKNKSLVSATNAQGVSVPEAAAATGHDKVLKLLLDDGVSPDFENPRNNCSLLHLAAISNHTNTARLLILRRAKVDAVDSFGFTPLQWAALLGSTETLELLLKHRADPNMTTAAFTSNGPFGFGRVMPSLPGRPAFKLEGNTALHLAALTAQTNAIELLLKWGAPVNAANADGMTALDIADQFGPPPFFLMTITMRLPFAAPNFARDNFNGRRKAAAALLEQAGGKHGENFHPGGMPMRFQ